MEDHGSHFTSGRCMSSLSGESKADRHGICPGCVENELGLRKFLEDRGHTFIVTDDKEGDASELDKHLPDTDVVRPNRQAALSVRRMLCLL